VRVLAEHFLRAQAELYDEQPKTLSDAALRALQQFAWPGNVRELANVIEHAHVLAAGDTIVLTDLPVRVQSSGGDDESDVSGSDLCLADIERRTIAEALRRTNHRKIAASRLLGINIQRLNRRMQKLKIRAQ
jgi:DNA-binding NtrC family response regulator